MASISRGKMIRSGMRSYVFAFDSLRSWIKRSLTVPSFFNLRKQASFDSNSEP